MKAPVLKTGSGLRRSWVRIPPPPPHKGPACPNQVGWVRKASELRCLSRYRFKASSRAVRRSAQLVPVNVDPSAERQAVKAGQLASEQRQRDLFEAVARDWFRKFSHCRSISRCSSRSVEPKGRTICVPAVRALLMLHCSIQVFHPSSCVRVVLIVLFVQLNGRIAKSGLVGGEKSLHDSALSIVDVGEAERCERICARRQGDVKG